jgi:transcriptional regulator with XRE-family HTH domain
MEKDSKIEQSEELQAIAKRLKELRKEKGYSNYEHIAFELGVSRSAYWGFEAGKNMTLKTVIKICKLLGVTLEEFFAGVNLPKAEKK